MTSGRVAPSTRRSAAERILQGALHALRRTGAAALSLQEVANEAGVSKGLIHYHFRDRETLLARLVEWIIADVIVRERAALAEATPQTAIDLLWGWLESELTRGYIRALLELGNEPGPLVSQAVRAGARLRREEAARTTQRLFDLLALRPRLPVPLLADVVVAFIDGLALDVALTPNPPRRVVFDVFWLSLLSLAE